MELIDFIAAIKTRNLARANKYSVELTFPTGSKEYSVSDPSHLTTLFCSSVSLFVSNSIKTPVVISVKQDYFL